MSVKQLYKLKLSATCYKVLFSSLIIATIVIPLYFFWFPYPLNQSLNINKMIVNIFFVNISLVVLLTFIFFNPERKDNKVNMLIISFFQVVAFFVGLYYLVQVRPAWLVHHQDRIYLVQTSSTIYPENVGVYEKVIDQVFGRVQLKTVKFSDNPSEYQDQLNQSVSGVGIEYQPLEYRGYDKGFALKYAQPVSNLLKYNTKNKVSEKLEGYSRQAKLWLPLRSSANGQDMVVLLDDKGSMVAIVALNPW